MKKPAIRVAGFFYFGMYHDYMTAHKRLKYTLIAILMALFFNYPLLDIANKKMFTGSVPTLYVYLSIVWIISILLLYITAITRKRTSKKNE